MADFDFASLMQNPLFMAGVQGLLANPQDRGRAMLQGAQAGQQMANAQQLQQMRALQLQQAQNAANFNPADYMKTTPNMGSAVPEMQQQQAQQPPMPATLGGVLGGNGTPMMQPSPQALQNTPIPQPEPGTPTGRVNMPALLQAGMGAGMQPGEVQGLANIMDPATAARMQLAGHLIDTKPGGVVFNGLGDQIAANSNLPPSDPVAILARITAARDKSIAAGDVQGAASLDALLNKYNGNATQTHQDTLEGLAKQRLAIEQQRLTGDPQQIEGIAKAIAAGQLAPLSGFAMKTQQGQAVMARVMELNPDYDAKNYAAGQKALNAYQPGSKVGDTIRSFNVTINHLATAGELADALQNGDMQTVNKVGNALGVLTGKPAVTSFNAAKSIVGDEIIKAIVGSGGGVTDREEVHKAMDAAQSPAQLKGVIQTYQKLLAGQLQGYQQQYEAQTHRKDFDRLLNGTTKSIIGGGGPAKTVIRTGTQNGRKVVQYSDGTTEYAD